MAVSDSIRRVLLIAAIVIFAGAAFGLTPVGGTATVAFGLAVLTASQV
jgi:hypothetical protein